MSERLHVPYAVMHSTAQQILEQLAPACERIEIAGSLRRQRQYCADIELVAIPKHIPNLFGEPSGVTQVDVLLPHWPVRMTKNGPKYKQFLFVDFDGDEQQVDLFLQPDPATWGINFLLRTGDAEFSRRMVTPKQWGGYMPNNCQVRDARLWRDGLLVQTPQEEDVFAAYDMEFVAPQDRG